MSRWRSTKSLVLMPQVSCCYAIYIEGKLVYVGSALNLRTRFAAHQIAYGRICCRPFRGDPSTALVKYRPSVRYGDWAMVELRLIDRLKPILNQKHKRRASYG